MSDAVWERFIARTGDLLKETYVEADTNGEWQGIKEQGRIFYGTTELSELDVLVELQFMRELFMQDAIGYQFGEGKLA